MADNNIQWSDKPNKPDHVHKRMQSWEEHLAEDQRDPNAKEKFDRATERAAKPEKSEPEKPAQSDGYSGK